MNPQDRHHAPPVRVKLRDGRDITIRLLEAADAQGVVDFYAAIPEQDGIYYVPPSARTGEKALARAAAADDPYEVCLVLADDAGVIHGEAWYRWSAQRPQQSLFGIAIRRTMQGVGAGRRIMTRLMEIGDAYGPPVMALTVQVENERAWKLYTSMGFVKFRQQDRAKREDSPPMPEFYMERRMGPAPRRDGDEARRAFWTAQMDEADAFLHTVLSCPTQECGEPMASLVDVVRQARVEAAFSQRPHVHGLPRQFRLRAGLVPKFLAAAAEMNARGWVLKVEDGYRSVRMQQGLGLHPQIFAAILQKVRWECGGVQPEIGLLRRRVGALIAGAPKVGTHMSGSAIDISVLRRDTGEEVDRGGPYLEMSERTPMDSPFVPDAARQNRHQITSVMRNHGFVAYPWEFWHYNAGDAYAECLGRTGLPARYGPVHVDLATGNVTPIDNPTEPLNPQAAIAELMERAMTAP